MMVEGRKTDRLKVYLKGVNAQRTQVGPEGPDATARIARIDDVGDRDELLAANALGPAALGNLLVILQDVVDQPL